MALLECFKHEKENKKIQNENGNKNKIQLNLEKKSLLFFISFGRFYVFFFYITFR